MQPSDRERQYYHKDLCKTRQPPQVPEGKNILGLIGASSSSVEQVAAMGDRSNNSLPLDEAREVRDTLRGIQTG